MITHLYSDPHYGHANIIKHAERPFADLEEMDKALMDNYRATVSGYSDPFVLWLGDCAWRLADLPQILDQLPGRKALILGNHDGKARRMAACGFEFVTERLWMDLGGVSTIVCHYPPRNAAYADDRHDGRFIARKPILGKGQVGIHGHTHEKLATFPGQKRVHVGVDAWNFEPVSIELVTALVKQVAS